MDLTIDINCDLGEGKGVERDIMPYISSCNIACGGHFGTLYSIREAVVLALQHEVLIGAHPSYDDVENFGRVALEWDELRFRESVTQQINLVKSVTDDLNATLHHVKMHGALYHTTAHLENESDWLINLLVSTFKSLKLYAPYGSLLAKKAQNKGITVLKEGFADRRYKNQNQLLAREQPHAVLHHADDVYDQIINMAQHHAIIDDKGLKHTIEADTICIHGDNKVIVAQWADIYHKLQANHLIIR